MSVLEQAHNDSEERTCQSFKRVQERLELLNCGIAEELKKRDIAIDEWQMELRDIKTFLGKESVAINGVWQEYTRRINDLKLELEMRCKVINGIDQEQKILAQRFDGLAEELAKFSKIQEKQDEQVQTLRKELQVGICEKINIIVKVVHSFALTKCVES